MTKQHIAVLTGKRGGYGAMKPMLSAIEKDPDLRLSLIATDQHVSANFGNTIEEIEKDFEVAATLDIEQIGSSPTDRTEALGRCMTGMASILEKLAPDVLVLYGDRGEVLATAMAAINLRIPIAHLQGGDISGNVDELMRHALTKLSQLHFPSTEDSADRIIRLGEDKERVFVVGDNHIDQIVSGDYTAADVVRERYNIPEGEKPIIVLQHPETIKHRDHFADMKATLQATLAQEKRTVIVYPCSDHGYEGVVRAIEGVRQRPGVSVHTNIEAPDFWGLMAICSVFVGNSSAGLIETPYFQIPAINIGDRQIGRAHSDNIIHCPMGAETVGMALDKALNDTAFADAVKSCAQPFGDGKAGVRIVKILKDIDFSASGIVDKRMTY